MAEPLQLSEGFIVNSSGDRIIGLEEIPEASWRTSIENRLSALEHGAREAPAELGPGGVEALAPPESETRQILVGDEVGIPENTGVVQPGLGG